MRVDGPRMRRIQAIESMIGAAFLTMLIGCQLDSPNESTTEQHEVSTFQTTYDFGIVPVGTISSNQTVSIFAPLTTVEDQVRAVTPSVDCTQFEVNAPGLPARVARDCLPECRGVLCERNPSWLDCVELAYYQFTIRFHPVFPAAVSCQVTVTAYSLIYNTTQNLVLTLRGTGR
jgi:hypothetical protein